MKNAHIILASKSPRRQELLAQAGYSFTVIPSDLKEIVEPGWSPEECVCQLARQKAAQVRSQVLADATPLPPNSVVLGADTVVACGNQIYGKPKDQADAYHILWTLSHHRHRVLSGVCVWPLASLEPQIACEVSYIQMKPMSDAEIWAYIATGEGMDKAGAYALQETGERYVDNIQGEFDNVVGLPIKLVEKLIGRC